MTILLSFLVLPAFILLGDSRGVQLLDYGSNRGAYLTKAQYYIGKHICNV
jgi:hypothetical protein